tara:strand:+ start:502 stop:1557 length:1056 start_codon:yes stop_codon:yes gene_type:complete
MEIKKNRQFKSLILNKDKPVIIAIKKIQNNPIKTLVIIDGKNKLIGTITDGDIRRGMLKGYTIKTKINKFVNKNPRKIFNNKIINYSAKKNIALIPRINRNKRLISIKILNHLEKEELDKKVDVVLMAGGFGKRLMPITSKIPKPMIKINNKPLLETIILNFKKYGITKFKVSTYYKSNFIRNYFKNGKKLGVNIRYLIEKKPLGTAGCLGMLKHKELKDNIIVHNGDIITNLNLKNLIKFHETINSDITVCAKEHINNSPFGEILYSGHKVKKILEKPKNINFINAGIYIFKKKTLKKINFKKMDMVKLIQLRISQGFKANIYPIYEYWADIGRKDTLQEILKEKNKWKN